MIKKRGLFLDRKAQAGHEIMFTIFEMLVFAFFAYLLFSFVNDIEDNTVIEKNYLARDLAMVTNTIYASPSSIVYKYSENLSTKVYKDQSGISYRSPENYYIKISNNLVKVREEGDDESISINYWYAGESPENLVVEDDFKNKDTIMFSKSLESYSGADSFYSSGSSGSGSLDLSGSCGDAIVSIAMQGEGHPYCMGSTYWDNSQLPPKDPNCVYNTCYFLEPNTKAEWKSKIKSHDGKCTIDCSSFTQWVYNYYALNGGGDKFKISGTAEDQVQYGKVADHNPNTDHKKYEQIKPNFNELQKGDLLFFAYTYTAFDKRAITHVGIYIGNKKFIHAGDPVGEAYLSDTYWQEKYIGAKRLC